MNICTICDKKFSTSYNLERHKLKKTPCKKIELYFACSWCDKRYINASSLNYHLKQKHDSKKTPKDSKRLQPFLKKRGIILIM